MSVDDPAAGRPEAPADRESPPAALTSPYQRPPSAQSRLLIGALRLGVRPLADRLPGRPTAIRVLRTTVRTGAWLLRTGTQVRLEPLLDPRVEEPGASRPVSGEWVRPAGADAANGVVLYLHGGGYTFCSPFSHRVITTRLALESDLPILTIRYRLAPEHPFPAAHDDVLDAYRWLLARGISADRIVVAGDSAGGNLAATLAGDAYRAGLPAPAGIVLFSPWIDLSCERLEEYDRRNRDPFISPTVVRYFGRLYLGGCAPTDPRLSPLSCPPTALPPFLIQVGGVEVLRTEAQQLAEALSAAGGACELQVWPGQMHVFQALHRIIPEAREALSEAARFIRTATGAGQSGASRAA